MLSLIISLLISLLTFDLYAHNPVVVPPDAVTAMIDLNAVVSVPVRPNFASFSIEVCSATGWTGNRSDVSKASWVSLMRQLMFTSGQAGPVMRIGGNSADLSLFNPQHKPNPTFPPGAGRNISCSVIPETYLALRRAAQSINSRFIFGVNMHRGNNASWAVDEVVNIARYIGWEYVESIEIGNENDLYVGNGIRPAHWSYQDYTREWLEYTKAIRAAVPTAPRKLFQGATWATSSYYPYIDNYLLLTSDQLSSCSFHNYPVNDCNHNTPEMWDLLSDHAVEYLIQQFNQYNITQSGVKYQVPMLIGEGNNSPCTSTPGFSNGYGTALWAIDVMFHIASINFTHWNFHGGGGGLYSFSSIVYRGGVQDPVPIVQPLYYGMKFFAMATQQYAHIVQTNIISRTDKFIKIWTTHSRERNIINIIIIHKNYNKTDGATITINIQTLLSQPTVTWPTAQVIRLLGPEVHSEFNLTLQGQTYDGTKDGNPIGQQTKEYVTPDTSGTYVVKVAPISAVLLVIDLNNTTAVVKTTEEDETEQIATLMA